MKVEIITSLGSIIVQLNQDKAPKTVENFLTYVKSGFYNETIFHRVIEGFMIQGGGMDKDMKTKPTHPSIENEASNELSNLFGTIARQEPRILTQQRHNFLLTLRIIEV